MSIIQFKSIELTDILYYKKAKFVFKNGITVIRGLNKNGDVDKNTNGVGKSLLFSCIPNIIYATTPLAKKNEKKSLLRSEKSEIRFTFKKLGSTWTIVQRSKKKAIEYDILKDGVSTEPRTLPIAEAKIKELFGISEELFYTKDYISVQRPHLFLRGTSTQRQEFFTEVFKLDHYDNLKKSFLLQVRELKSKKVKLDLLKEQLSEVEERLTRIDWSNKKEKQINELETQLNETNKSYLSYITQTTDMQTELNLAEEIGRKCKKANTKFTVEELKAKQKKLKRQLSELQDYNEYTRAKRKYDKDTKSLSERLEVIEEEIKGLKNGSTELSLSDIKRRLEKLYTKRSDAESKVERLVSLRDRYSSIEDSIPEGSTSLSVDEATRRIGELEQIIELHDAVGKIENDCPLCGAKIKGAVFGRIAGDAKKELPKRKKDLAIAKGLFKLKEIQKEAKEYRGCEDELTDIKSRIQKLEREKQLVERSTRLQEARADIADSIKQIRKPRVVEAPDTNADEGDIEAQIRKYSGQVDVLLELEDLQKDQRKTYGYTTTVDNLESIKDIEHNLSGIKKKQSKLVTRINEINEILPNLLSQQKQVIEHIKTKEELQHKIEDIQTQLSDLPVLEALIKAYGSKGLKVDVMKQIASLVEANLNKYSGLIFAEAFQFKIEVSENSFPVMVDRGGLISDVSKLSGAEGMQFILLLLLSMLPLIPRRLRADAIVLDEVDAFLGPPLKKLFFTKFLPILNSVVPKICVITTDTKTQVEGARNILVEKEGKVSSLKEIFALEGIL